MKKLYRLWLRASPTEDDIERTKVRLLIAFSIIGVVVSILYWFVHPIILFNVPRILYLIFPLSLIVWCTLLIFRVHHFWVAQLIVCSYYVAFAVSTYYAGGIYSVVLPWISVVPVMANLILTYRHSATWFAACFVTVIVFSLMHDQVPELLYTKGPWRAALSITGLTLILFFFTSLFDRARYRLLNVVRGRNHELVQKQHDIETQNEEISSQLEYIEEKHRESEIQKGTIAKINAQLHQKVQEIIIRNEVLERHWNTLLDISKSKSINFGEIEDALKEIARIAAHSIEVSRVSVWTYDGKNESISCKVCYNRTDDKFEESVSIFRAVNPAYFEALRMERVVSASDARSHSGTKGFNESYLVPLNIYSLLDAPFFIDSELGGVICCEHQKPKTWSAEDIIFATSMADIISLAFRAAQRRDYERQIRQQSKEITRMNETLEERVRQRTETLENQNQQLAEYAYINSHKLRGPLSRILGLVNILDNAASVPDKMILTHLKHSCNELDQIIRKINEAIDRGGHFNRDNFGK